MRKILDELVSTRVEWTFLDFQLAGAAVMGVGIWANVGGNSFVTELDKLIGGSTTIDIKQVSTTALLFLPQQLLSRLINEH